MRLQVFVPPDGPDHRRVSFFKDLFSDSPGSFSDRQPNETQRHLEEPSGSLGGVFRHFDAESLQILYSSKNLQNKKKQVQCDGS